MPFRRNARKPNTSSTQKKARSNAAVAKIAKTVVSRELKKTVEVKHAPYGVENQQLYHNVPFLADSNIFSTTQGTSDPATSSVSNRIGDSVYFKNLLTRLWLAQKLDRPNIMVRVTLLYRRNTTVGGILTNSPFNTITGNGNLILANIDNEAGNVVATLYDRVFTYNDGHDLSSGGSPKEAHHLVKIWKKLNRRVTYYADGGSVPKNFSPQLWITAYDSWATTTLDKVASFAMTRYGYFTDM